MKNNINASNFSRVPKKTRILVKRMKSNELLLFLECFKLLLVLHLLSKAFLFPFHVELTNLFLRYFEFFFILRNNHHFFEKMGLFGAGSLQRLERFFGFTMLWGIIDLSFKDKMLLLR